MPDDGRMYPHADAVLDVTVAANKLLDISLESSLQRMFVKEVRCIHVSFNSARLSRPPPYLLSHPTIAPPPPSLPAHAKHPP